MQEIFNLTLLQAINDWQCGGTAKQNLRRGQALKKECLMLPKKYRESTQCCFRQVALPKRGVWDLIGDDKLTEKISSWTTDINIAKTFKGGVPPKDQGYQGVILCLYPQPESVIINLSELYKDSEFKESITINKDAINGYHNGIGCFWDSQHEVVLEIHSVDQSHIYSMGGHSDDFDKLVMEAAKLTYGRQPTPEEYQDLLLKAESVRSFAGAGWLTPEATQRVLTRMKPKAEALKIIKKYQDGSGSV